MDIHRLIEENRELLEKQLDLFHANLPVKAIRKP